MDRTLISHNADLLTDAEFKEARAHQDAAFTQTWAVPMIVGSAVTLWAAWLLARHGARYRVVKWTVFPIVHFISCFLCSVPAFIICMFMGNATLAADISLFSSVWLPAVSFFWSFLPGMHMVPPEAIPQHALLGTIIYQLVAYFLFTKWIVRNVTLAIVDAANVKRAMSKGIDINLYRCEKARDDLAYRRDALFYESRGIVPPWSYLLIGFTSGFASCDYYFGTVDAQAEHDMYAA